MGGLLEEAVAKHGPEAEPIALAALGMERSSDRTHANRYYAEQARPIVREWSKQVRIPEAPAEAARLRVGMDWIAKRAIVLAELGRLMAATEHPTPEEIAQVQDTAWYIAAKRPNITAKEAAAYVRRVRLGIGSKRVDRVRELHREINRLVAAHRRKYPEGKWAEVREALEYSVAQVSRKVPPSG